VGTLGRCSGIRRRRSDHACDGPGSAVTQAPPARFDLILPARFRLNQWDYGAISPDGRQFVFSAQVDGPLRHLVRRDLSSTEMHVIPDTENPWRPFWSPDSQWIAFIVAHTGQLKKVLVSRRTRTAANRNGA
jgi:Tol biopolymer transport system component